jgi:hypothetical protein
MFFVEEYIQETRLEGSAQEWRERAAAAFAGHAALRILDVFYNVLQAMHTGQGDSFRLADCDTDDRATLYCPHETEADEPDAHAILTKYSGI